MLIGVAAFGISFSENAPVGCPSLLQTIAFSLFQVVEKNLPLDLEDLVKKAAALFGDKLTNKNVVADVVDFMFGRFRAWY